MFVDVLSILVQCSIFVPPENVREPNVFLTFSGGLRIEHWVKSKQHL